MRKAFVLFSIVMFGCMFLGIAQAGELGAPAPYAKEGKYAASLGYSYYNDVKVKDDQGDTTKLTQNQFTLEGDYGLAKGWELFLRVGMADLKAEDFHSDYSFLGTLGFRGLFYESGPFGVGGTVEGTYYGEFKDGDVKFTNPYELALGIAGQYNFGPAIVYAGPYVYMQRAKVEFPGGSTDVEEKSAWGGYGGLRFGIPGGAFGNLEYRYQSGNVFSITLGKAF